MQQTGPTSKRSGTNRPQKMSRGGKIEVVKLLISEGADVNVGAEDIPALVYAIVYGQTEIARFLLANGADPNLQGRQSGIPILHMAVYGGNTGLVDLLVQKGIDVNTKDRRGKTTMDWAKQYDKEEMIELLKKHGVKE